jgi:hypothetical protein
MGEFKIRIAGDRLVGLKPVVIIYYELKISVSGG